MNQYREFIHRSRYARWIEAEGRREAWDETVDRYMDYFASRVPDGLWEDYDSIYDAIYNMEVMPSMRAMATAGKALDRDNVAGYNCSYLAVDSPRAFDEAMYILMCGTGVGFSVEEKFTSQLPAIADALYQTDTRIVIRDSKIGWATGFRELVALLYSGKIPSWDTSKVRPSGAKLKTFGGRASGPEPLESLFKFTVELFRGATGRKLRPIECHDLMCKVAEIVVVGGVRRSALISLSDLHDHNMRVAKSGRWYEEEPQRMLANNSICYVGTPPVEVFLDEWKTLYESRSGERGIFNREAAKRAAGRSGRRDTSGEFGTNPCSEIILRPKQFCNLTEVVVRSTDTLQTLRNKVRLATILGTLQSTLTDFRYLSREWQRNTEEERLLGVSLTGIMDNQFMSGRADYFVSGTGEAPRKLEDILDELRNVAIETNREWAERLGVAQSAAITCVKPSGTVSQLVDSASGIHPRFSGYYIRRVRADKKDPLAQMMRDQGVPCEDDKFNPNVYVFSFPIKAPDGAVTVNEVSALEQLELWKKYQNHWCEHKPSITVYYRSQTEFMDVGAWVYRNFEDVSGISFLPQSDHVYEQAPYEAINQERHEVLLQQMPVIDWSKLVEYEHEDTTVNTKELACSAGVCEL